MLIKLGFALFQLLPLERIVAKVLTAASSASCCPKRRRKKVSVSTSVHFLEF
jgi:hypothetical protein